MVLQEQSDAPLPAGRGKNAKIEQFNAYADQFERFIHNGAQQRYTETELFGSLAACDASGLNDGGRQHTSASSPPTPTRTPGRGCMSRRRGRVPTWSTPQVHDARPDDAHGEPIVDRERRRRREAVLHEPGRDVRRPARRLRGGAAANAGIAGVIPVGDAFQLAVDRGQREVHRLLRRERRLRAAAAGRTARPVVGRRPARQQVRLVPGRAGAVRHRHRTRSAVPGAGESAAIDLGISSGRRAHAAADRLAGARHRRRAGALDLGAAGRRPAARRPLDAAPSRGTR